MNSTGRQARPSANATGTRSTISTKNVPKSHSAATCGVSAAPVMRVPPSVLRSYGAPRTDVARLVNIVVARAAAGDVEVKQQTLAPEQQPRQSGERPRDEDVRHRQVGEFGGLIPPE